MTSGCSTVHTFSLGLLVLYQFTQILQLFVFEVVDRVPVGIRNIRLLDRLVLFLDSLLSFFDSAFVLFLYLLLDMLHHDHLVVPDRLWDVHALGKAELLLELSLVGFERLP